MVQADAAVADPLINAEGVVDSLPDPTAGPTAKQIRPELPQKQTPTLRCGWDG